MTRCLFRNRPFYHIYSRIPHHQHIWSDLHDPGSDIYLIQKPGHDSFWLRLCIPISGSYITQHYHSTTITVLWWLWYGYLGNHMVVMVFHCVHVWFWIIVLAPIKLKIWWKFAVLWFKICLTDHNEILHKSRQCYCRDMCKISLWSAEYVMNKSITNFQWISNSIEILLVGPISPFFPL